MQNNNQNRLAPQNCNKAKCKSCMFGSTPISLSQERLAEIHAYLSKFESSHICHTTNKTCYGALEFQAKLLHSMGIIVEPSVTAMLEVARKALGL